MATKQRKTPRKSSRNRRKKQNPLSKLNFSGAGTNLAIETGKLFYNLSRLALLPIGYTRNPPYGPEPKKKPKKRAVASKRPNKITAFIKKAHGFFLKESQKLYVGETQFPRTPDTIFFSVKALQSLNAATLGSAAILFNRPKLKNLFTGKVATSLTGSVATVAGAMAVVSHLENRHVMSNLPQACNGEWERATGAYFSDFRQINYTPIHREKYQLNPLLVSKVNSSATARQYYDWIVEAANDERIDSILYANQLFQESAGFRADVVSGQTNSYKGAVGIAQFLPSSAKRLYGASLADLKNPQKAISLGARHMADLMRSNGNDQILAMVAYNGGESQNRGPIGYVERKLGTNNISGVQWMQYMDARRRNINCRTYASHAWHNESFKYVSIITGASWSKDTQALAANTNLALR